MDKRFSYQQNVKMDSFVLKNTELTNKYCVISAIPKQDKLV